MSDEPAGKREPRPANDVGATNPQPVAPGHWDEDSGSDSIPCVWFFLPLPHPIGLPEGEALARSSDAGLISRETASPSGLECSLSVHQVPRSTNIMLRDLSDVVSLIHEKAFEKPHSKKQRARELRDIEKMPGFDSSLTVVEAAVPGVEAEWDRMDAALDRCIELIRELQIGVATALGVPVRLISRATLPPILSVVTGRISMDGNPPVFEAIVPDFHVENSAPPATFGLKPEPLTQEQLTKVQKRLGEESDNVAFELVARMRREALVQAHMDGNTALSVVSVAAAGELLLNTALMHCCWEESMHPAEAARLVQNHKAGLRTAIGQLSSRLGGSWHLQGDGPVARFYGVAQIRNRILHGGYEPTAPEMRDAVEALEHFEKFIGDSLATKANLRRYPRTALAWSGASGIQRRRRYQSWLDGLQADTTEPKWGASFRRWRKALDEELGWQRRGPGEAPDDCLIYLRREWGQPFRCFVHDRGTGHVAGISALDHYPQDVITRSVEFLSSLFAVYRGERQLMLPWLDSLPLDQLKWVPDYAVIPEIRIQPGGRFWDLIQKRGY